MVADGTRLVKHPEIHMGKEALAMFDREDVLLDKVYIEAILGILTEKELDTITMWSQQFTFPEIALFLFRQYGDGRRGKPLSRSGISGRIQKILHKLRKHAKSL